MNIELKTIQDPNLVKYYLKEKDLATMVCQEAISDDFTPNMQLYSWIEINVDDVAQGLLMLREVFPQVITFHGGTFKEFRGKYTTEVLKESLEKLREILKCQFISSCAEDNHIVQTIYKKCGLEYKMKIKHFSGKNHVVYAENI